MGDYTDGYGGSGSTTTYYHKDCPKAPNAFGVSELKPIRGFFQCTRCGEIIEVITRTKKVQINE